MAPDVRGFGRVMNYERLYRIGLTPWERYGSSAAEATGRLLDREVDERDQPPGRALDIGCGRGVITPELARRGWDAVGIDNVRRAVEAARRASDADVTYVVGDVTELSASDLGTFDFFLDIGCFQGLDGRHRLAEGRGVTALAKPEATLLLLAFGATRLRSLVGGVSQEEVEEAFEAWDLVVVEPADTAGLGWPMNRTSPSWYRLRLRGMSS